LKVIRQSENFCIYGNVKEKYGSVKGNSKVESKRRTLGMVKTNNNKVSRQLLSASHQLLLIPHQFFKMTVLPLSFLFGRRRYNGFHGTVRTFQRRWCA